MVGFVAERSEAYEAQRQIVSADRFTITYKSLNEIKTSRIASGGK